MEEQQKEGKVISFAAHKGERDAEKMLKSQMAPGLKKGCKTSSLGKFKSQQKRRQWYQRQKHKFSLLMNNICHCHLAAVLRPLIISGIASVLCFFTALLGLLWTHELTWFVWAAGLGSIAALCFMAYLLVKAGKSKSPHHYNCSLYDKPIMPPPQRSM